MLCPSVLIAQADDLQPDIESITLASAFIRRDATSYVLEKRYQLPYVPVEWSRDVLVPLCETCQ